MLAAEQLFRCGEWDEGYRELRVALTQLGIRLPRSRASLVARLLWRRARARLRSLDASWRAEDELPSTQRLRLRAYSVATHAYLTLEPLMGAYCASRHLELSRERARDHALRAFSDELSFLSGAGHREARRVERLVAKIHELLPAAENQEDRLYAEMMLGAVPLLFGRFDQASAKLSESERILSAHARHMTWELGMCRMLQLTADMFHVGLARTAKSIDVWIADASQRRDEESLRYFVTKRVLAHRRTTSSTARGGARTRRSSCSP